MLKYDLDTPAVVIDLDVLDRNIRDMAELCEVLGVALRPHTKTHKIPEIADMQVAAGASGITCQKLGEAEVMTHGGLDDILITYHIVGQSKLKRLTDLARWTDVLVTVDSEAVVEGISRQATHDGCEVGVLVELDTGGNRTGVQSPRSAQALGRKVTDLPGLSLQGVMTYPSRAAAKPFVEETLALFDAAGLPHPIVSGGGTGHERFSREIGCTETRSGSYIYEGLQRVHGSSDLDPATCPLSILVTVVSVPTRDRVIVDGGMKSFQGFPRNPYGLVAEYPEAKTMIRSVEHGELDLSQCSHRLKVGDKVSILPRHAGMTCNLHDRAAGVRGERVEVVWPIRGRGKVS